MGGCLVQFFQIITGINAMVSFGGTLFKTLGVTGLLAALAPSICFFVGNAIGGFGLVDRLGRRSLLVWGMAGMAVTMLVGGITALAGETLLFFGGLSALVVPFALLCLPETKGRTLEEITPLFRFKDLREFRTFVRGNLRCGDGMGMLQTKGEPVEQEASQATI